MSIWKKLILGVLGLLVVISALYAHTDDTSVGRMPLTHPDLGHEGGSALHTKVKNAWTAISNDMDSRWDSYSAIADDTLSTITHNFGTNNNQLDVQIFTGTHPDLTRVEDISLWTIAENGSNPKTQIDVTTPASGGPHTFSVLTMQGAKKTNELRDMDLAGIIEGQVPVYNAATENFEPGSSGDSSFKLIGFTDTTVTTNAGTERYNGGKLYCTHDGTGATESDITTNHVVDVSALETLGASATWYMYYDTNGATETTLTDSGRICYMIANDDYFISASHPNSGLVSLQRYRYLGSFTTDGDSDIDAIYAEIPRDASSWANIKLIEDKVVAYANYPDTSCTNLGYGSFINSGATVELYDSHNAVSNDSGWKFVAPRDGKYSFGASFIVANDANLKAGQLNIAISINGNAVTGISGETLVARVVFDADDLPNNPGVSGSIETDLSNGDVVRLLLYQSIDLSSSTICIDGRKGNSYVYVHEVTNTQTDAIATPQNVWKSRLTAAGSNCTDTDYQQVDPPSYIDGKSLQLIIDYYDDDYNGTAVSRFQKNIIRDTYWEEDNGYYCVKWESGDFDTSDYADVEVRHVLASAIPATKFQTKVYSSAITTSTTDIITLSGLTPDAYYEFTMGYDCQGFELSGLDTDLAQIDLFDGSGTGTLIFSDSIRTDSSNTLRFITIPTVIYQMVSSSAHLDVVVLNGGRVDGIKLTIKELVNYVPYVWAD